MKKIGLWMAALTAVTVGGVYATFDYANNFNFEKSGEVTLDLAGAVPKGAVGEFAVDTSGLVITIDSAQSVYPNNYAALGYDAHKPIMVATGSIKITFTPYANAETTVANNGIEASFSFAPATDIDTWTYTAVSEDDETVTTGTKIFTDFSDCAATIYPIGTPGQSTVWTKEGDNLVYEIKADTLFTKDSNDDNDLLVLNPDIVLGTQAEHVNFKTALSGKVIIVTVISGTGSEGAEPEKV